MTVRQTKFSDFIAAEVEKVRGIYMPVKSSLLRRALVRRLRLSRLHPNPDDEFCDPDIGPNYSIINDYEHDIVACLKHHSHCFDRNPLIVERIRPDGYIIHNGHHRWAAAVHQNLYWVPVRVVNLTQEADIERMLKESRHDRRVTMDLDEVVLAGEGDANVEKAPPFPFRLIYRERLRQGVPALFRYLSAHGYDIWVFSARYYSMDYIQHLFRLYHVRVTGVITGTARKRGDVSEQKQRVENLFARRYATTLHVDRDSVLRVDAQARAFEEHRLPHQHPWAREVEDIIAQTGTQPAGE